MKILMLPLRASLGHFKVNYTTGSKLTYDIPTFTAIEGLIGAIMGWSRNEYIERIRRSEAKIGIIIRNPIVKVVYGINAPNDLISPSRIKKVNAGVVIPGVTDRTQMYYEFLIDPGYTILFAHSDQTLFQHISEQVLRKRSIYNMYFGSAFCIAEYDGEPYEIDSEPVYVENCSVVSVLDAQIAKEGIFPETNVRYLADNIPFLKDSDLTVKSLKQVIYSPDGIPLKCTGTFYPINDKDYVQMF